ncbi:hypothetical protein TSOC_005267 [Tetrabaena socialis]|uniref:Uncharacterized protein n=1 Tax=Tetrabaena socialis TaxID=47790 RepID=A0A2J8A6M0_9CHLO|nr:hypothetical protein TSOC_005267 [Tetrabaena socialis]|eukprot:PNH08181.1 hypothetical protein TSOC_005267 [Tetrabaena socialis]
MAPKKKCDKRPNKFWEPFNTWWRDHHERTGNRATVVEMREWYWQNAHQVWSAEMVPSLEEMLKLAKGMRTIQQVQDYFRIYRKNLKTRKDGDARSTKDGGVKKPARHPAVQCADGPEVPGGFMEAMQEATQQPPPQQQRHCQQQLLAHGASVVAMAAAVAAAAAAAATAAASAPQQQQQQQGHGLGGDEESQLQLDAFPLVVEGEEDPEDGQHPGRADEGGSRAASPDNMAAEQPASYGHWESAQQQQHLESMQQCHQQQQYLPGVSQADFAHRRVMRSVRTSGGGGGSGAVNAVRGSLGGAAVVQTVTRRRTIHTSAGGAWEQEVVEELELDVAQASPLPYGMPMMPYGGMQQQHQCGTGVFATLPHVASAGQAWYHGRGMGAGADTAAAAHAPDGSCTIAAGAPPYKQQRCEDHGAVSAERFSSDGAGVEGADPSCSGQQQAQQEPGMPAVEHGDDAPYNPARRTAYSYGGHPSYPADDLRHKPPHSSDGGVLYGAAPPPYYHPGYHAPPPYHGPAGGSYGGMHAAWQQHAQQQQQRYPHPAYAHHPAYAAYRHPQAAYPHAPPPYGHPHPHAGYMPPPYGHMPMPYHPAYGHMPMQRNPYGGPYQSYYARPPPEASMMADVDPTVEQEEEDAAAAHDPAEATVTAAAAAEQHDVEAQPQAHVRAVGQATPLQPHAHHRHHYHHAHGPEAAAATPATVRPLRLEDLPPMQLGLPGFGCHPAAGAAVSESFSGLGLSGLTALGQASEGGDEAASHGGGHQPAGEGEGAGAAAAAGADHRRHHHHSQQQQHPRGAGVAAGRGACEETLIIVRRPDDRGSCGGAAVVSSGSDGGGTDGTANLFLTAAKVAAAAAAAGHSSRRVSSTGAHPGHHHSGLPPRPAATPLHAPALTPATQPLKLLSGGPTTIRVFQEDMLVLPFGPLGDMAGMGLYSPTASFTLSLGLGEGDGGCGGEVMSWGMGAHGHA